ncbi:class I SAM-dependent methyltransferase [Anaeromicropila herbilytica]|uniref:Methyltransferase type 11 domain-containing protein n=1 Tax=Anaeromicropila herbilytica TaxID=2785025 RepID=A0A7R7EHX5_9FIRM|nr:class I SAM-dependent methyltransferase [Anaeromicropila herbilytica]BCN29082.1 hypothetical protein bsdtb5_03770 [Anaeromicropila herbilytica]
MSFNWIDKSQYTLDSFLLMDRWLIRMIINTSNNWPEYAENLSLALASKPYVAWYCSKKAPEIKEKVEQLVLSAPLNATNEQIKKAEEFIVEATETSIIYTDPINMNRNCNYIYNWKEERLLELVDFKDKIVLDIGSGTGRLAFAAAKLARKVYASEPTDMLREYMKDKIKNEGISNVVVVDGTVEHIPYEDNTFDIVMSAHVVGDYYDAEIAEMERVAKNNGYILDCIGDDDRIREKPDEEMLKRGFEYLYHKSTLGGDIYRYRKQVMK